MTDEVLMALTSLATQVGEVNGTVKGIAAALPPLFERVRVVETEQARQQGERKFGVKVMSAVTGVGSVVGGGLFHLAAKKLGW